MGIGGISIWQLLIILLIVVMLFGTKRLKSLGADLGDAIKGFRKSMGNAEDEQSGPGIEEKRNHTIDASARKVDEPSKKD